MKQFFDFSLQLEYFLQLQAGFQLGKTRILSQPWNCLKADGNSGYQIRTHNCSVWGFSFFFLFNFFNGKNWSDLFWSWCQNFGVWGAVGPPTCWEWRRIVSLLCMGAQLCCWSFPVKSHSIHRDSAFGRAPLLVAPWSFLELQEPVCTFLLESGGSEGCPWDLKQ